VPLRDQYELIHSERWDYLIVLDACRYDYFAEGTEGMRVIHEVPWLEVSNP